MFLPLLLFILPAAGLTTLAACPAAPAARARACVPEVPARLSPASAGLGRAGPFPSWPRPWPRPRPRPSPSASAFAYGLGLGLALGLGLRLGLLHTRALLAGPQLLAAARGRRASPCSPALLCRHFSSALLAVTLLALTPLRRPSYAFLVSGRGWHGSSSHTRRRPGRRLPSWVSRARRSCSLKAGRWGARALSC